MIDSSDFNHDDDDDLMIMMMMMMMINFICASKTYSGETNGNDDNDIDDDDNDNYASNTTWLSLHGALSRLCSKVIQTNSVRTSRVVFAAGKETFQLK